MQGLEAVEHRSRLGFVHPGECESEVDYNPVPHLKEIFTIFDEHRGRNLLGITLHVDEYALLHCVDRFQDPSGNS